MRNVDHFLILIFSGDNEVSRHEFDHFYTQVLILVYERNYIRWFSHTSTETKWPLVFNCKNCLLITCGRYVVDVSYFLNVLFTASTSYQSTSWLIYLQILINTIKKWFFLVSYYEEMVPKQKRLPNFDQIKFYKGRHIEFEIYPKNIFKHYQTTASPN